MAGLAVNPSAADVRAGRLRRVQSQVLGRVPLTDVATLMDLLVLRDVPLGEVKTGTQAVPFHSLKPLVVRSEILLRVKEHVGLSRSEERRAGKECRSRWSPDH